MSDTTTITPEERANLRRVAALAKDGRIKTIPLFHSDVTDFLDALEAAEAENNHARNWVEHLDKLLAERTEDYEAEHAENAKLRAEHDWLAGKLAELHDTSLRFLDDAPDGSNRKTYWKEAARRSVAESEVGE